MEPHRDFDSVESYNLRAHYEDVTANTLRSITRHMRLIAALVAIALASAGLLISQLPRGYSAEALVQPDLILREVKANQAPLASIEAASLVNSDARFIRSPAMVSTVVKRLGLDGDPEFAAPSSAIFRGLDRLRAAILPEVAVTSPLERAASRVRHGLAVTNETRSYLISISFTASSPEKAANVANAFPLEYLRVKTMQRLTDAVTAASSELARRSWIYGERHPSIVQVKGELAAARSRLQAVASRPEVTARGIASGGGVTLAEPSPTPSSPKGFVILGLAFVFAMVSGIGLAVWLDRRQADVSAKNELLARTGDVWR